MAERRRARLGAGLAVAAGLLLAGCSNPWLPGRGIYQLGSTDAPPTGGQYCYRTLAEVTCYPEPLPAGETRRVGWADVARETPGPEPDPGR